MDIFWTKSVHLNRLHIGIVRNDSIAQLIQNGTKKKNSIRLDRIGGQVFFSLRLGTRFLQVDWV